MRSWQKNAKSFSLRQILSRLPRLLPLNNAPRRFTRLAHLKTTAETLWISAPLLWRFWGNDLVVYNSVSGNTHVLTPAAGEVLKLLENRPQSPTEIAQAISSAVGVSLDEEIMREVHSLLTSLDELGLIRPTV